MKKILFRSLLALAIFSFLSLSFSMQNKTHLRPGEYALIPETQNNTALVRQEKLQNFFANPDLLKGLSDQETAEIQLGDYTSILKSRSILAVNVDNDCSQEIVVDFGALGLYLYDPFRTPKWERISTKDVESMIAADRNGDGIYEIYANWGFGNGSEYWEDGIGWTLFNNAGWWDYFYCSMDHDNDGDDEIVIGLQNTSTYVYRLYLAQWETYGFSWTEIYIGQTDASYSVAFNLPGDELVSRFTDSPRIRWWNYQSGDSDQSDNWTSMTDAYVDSFDCIKAEIGDDSEEEFIMDIYDPIGSRGTWIYNFSSSPKWTRINAMELEDIRTWRRTTGSNDELLCSLSGISGLWYYSHSDTQKWKRLNGLTPDTDGGFVEVFNYDSDSDWDIAVDFKYAGLWKYDYNGTPKWTSMNGSNARFMIRANVDNDSDDELIVVFESSPAGIWIWDNGSTPKWQRINGANPD